jgi:hypothetical protein
MCSEDVLGIDGVSALINDLQTVAVAQRDAVLAALPAGHRPARLGVPRQLLTTPGKLTM